MRKFIWCFFVQLTITLGLTQGSFAQYVPVNEGSSVTFRIKNFGFNSEGSFSGLEGKITFDPVDPAKALFDVSVSTASVNTDNNSRDNHLRKEEYFDAQNHPRIRFVSTAVKAGDKKESFMMTGKLTIKSTTKDISFPFVATYKDNGYLFNGEFTINRKDFGVGGTSPLSNSLTVHLAVFAKKE